MEQPTRTFIRLVCLLLIAVCAQWTHATHVMGFYTEMQCLNACTTRVHFRGYRDCNGATGIPTQVTFVPTTSCAVPDTAGPLSATIIGEVTPVCPNYPTRCFSAMATFPGVEEYAGYQDYDVCGLTGCEYDVTWSGCCRNGAITSGPANVNAYLQNHITLQATCNNTPVFLNYPLFFGCTGVNYQVHQGAYDPDGDSLAYAFSACYDVANTSVPYVPGYSATQPLGPSWNCSLDPATGILSLTATPGNAEVGVICITAYEYRNGVLIGTSMRDMQIQIGNFCGSSASPAIQAITNAAGCTILSANEVAVCPGAAMCFDITATDFDTIFGQTLKLFWNNGIAGATFTQVGAPAVMDTVYGYSPDGRFCWTAPMTNGSYQFLLTALDNGCPLPIPRDQLITIHVGAGGPSNVISNTGTYQPCAGTGDTLSTPAGYATYLWSTGALTQSIVTSTAGVYSVTISTASGCSYWDAIAVAPGPPDITGIITDHLGAPLAGQKVYLIDHDPLLASLSAVDSTTTDTAGYYEFCSVALDTAYIKAAPDSATYPLDMPTYANASLFWMTANGIPAPSLPTTVSFATLFGSNPGGPGFIGGLLSQGANKVMAPGDPMPGQTMWLYSSTLSQPIDYTVTDANGYFFFGDLPYGTYYVIADKPRVSVTNLPVVTVDAQHVIQDSLDFRLHSTYLELVTNSVGVAPAKPGFSIDVVPNPVGDMAAIVAEIEVETNFIFSVYDLCGRQIYTSPPMGLASGQHRIPFTPKQWGIPAGTYFVRVQAGAVSHTLKVVVQ